MNRNELFEPGRYSSLPDVFLRDPTLAASAKLVWMALAGHLGPSGTEVWPSMTRLSRRTGLSRATVLRAVGDLEDAGLIAVRRQPSGKSNLYRILQPQAGPSAEKQYQNDTGSKMTPVAECNPTGIKMTPEAVSKCNPKYCSSTERSTPPNPKGEKTESGGTDFSPEQKTETKAAMVRRIDAAHVEAFGKPLPAKWKRDIRLEFDDGDRAALERIDAAVLTEAEKYRRVKHWSCLGHGTVMQYLAHLDRKAAAKRKKSAKTKATEAEEAEKAELEQAKMDHFQGLGQAKRQFYLDQAYQQFPHMKNPFMVVRQAAHAAWLEFERTPVEVQG